MNNYYVKDMSKNENHNNYLFVGDNKFYLESMQEDFENQVDLIYIDPPYNTKNKFEYKDSFNRKEWLEFMRIRLELASNLLAKDGVIFISIDDNEQAYLKVLCDDVFGEKNFISCVSVVNNMSGRSDKKFIATAHEYLLIYAKDVKHCKLNGFELTEEQLKTFNHKDEFGAYKLEGLWKTGRNSRREDRPNLYYPIYYNEETQHIDIIRNSPQDIEIFPKTNDYEGNWVLGKETFMARKDKDIEVKYTNKGEWKVYAKVRTVVDGVKRTSKPKSIWIDPRYASINGTKEIKDIFGNIAFTNPKPINFIKDIIKLYPKNDALILDFFAGSGTTGHAVMEVNAEDGGTRQFILCTNNEISEDIVITYLLEKGFIENKKDFIGFKSTPMFDEIINSSDLVKLGLANRITKFRLDSAINGYKNNPPLDSGYKYYYKE